MQVGKAFIEKRDSKDYYGEEFWTALKACMLSLLFAILELVTMTFSGPHCFLILAMGTKACSADTKLFSGAKTIAKNMNISAQGQVCASKMCSHCVHFLLVKKEHYALRKVGGEVDPKTP